MMVAALTCLAVIAYAYVGYPATIAALAALFGRPTSRDPSFEPTVTVCLPVCNDAAGLRRKLASLAGLDYPAHKLNILVFSDGSTDGTERVALAAADDDPRIRVLRSAVPLGKPHALNCMIAAATGEVLVLTDVRQRVAPAAVRELVATLADTSVGCASGTLALAGDAGAGAYWRYELWIRRNESRFRSMVGATGALYALRRRDAPRVPRDIVLDDMWIPMRIRLTGKRVLLCDRAVVYDSAADDRGEFGRKARTLYGNFQLLRRMPRLLVPFANPSWFELVSHKVARLLCPWALAVLLGATVLAGVAADPPPAWTWIARALVAGQLAFYGAALAGERLGRPARLARTFVVLNAAALVGLWRFIRGAQPVTWRVPFEGGRS